MLRIQSTLGNALRSVSIASAVLSKKQEIAKKSVEDTRIANLKSKASVEKAKADIKAAKASQQKSTAAIEKARADVAKNKYEKKIYQDRLMAYKQGGIN